jgi:ferrochelatase
MAEVEGFLFNLFNDPYIIQLPKLLKPYQTQLAKFISSRRASKVAHNYEKLGGSSPILFETQCQAKALEKRLGEEYRAYIAMRYSYPYLKDSLQDMEREGITELTVLPLYPQYSLATSGSSIIECKELFDATGFTPKVQIKYIEAWYDNPSFIELIANRIEDSLNNTKSLFSTHILFSAHGLPVKYIQEGDPYQKQIEDCVSLVLQKLSASLNLRSYKNKLSSELYNLDWSISYQSRVGPVKWLEPYTDSAIKKLGRNGVKNLIVVPISFVGDHIETIEEIGMQYRDLAHQNDIVNFKVTRLPKANPLLIEALASLVLKHESTSLQSKFKRNFLSSVS